MKKLIKFQLTEMLFDKRFNEVNKYQKQPSRGALRKRCSKKLQQIYRRTPMPKCDLQLY